MRYNKIVEYKYNMERSLKLNDSTPYKCRFCGRTLDKNAFKQKAHAVSEFLGNHSILTSYECDECNGKFAKYEENELAKFTLLYRALRGFKGKHKTKIRSEIECNYEEKTQTFSVKCEDLWDKNFHIQIQNLIDGKTRKTIVHAQNEDIYNFRLIFKALLKYVLSILPENLVVEFQEWYNMLLNDDCRKLLLECITYYSMDRQNGITLYEDFSESGTSKYIATIDFCQYQYVMFFKENPIPPEILYGILGIHNNTVYACSMLDYSDECKKFVQNEELIGVEL